MRVTRLVLCWSAVSFAGIAVCAAEDPIEDVIKVEVTGTLRTGLMAIGGETTGTGITSNGVTWELDFSKSPKLKAIAWKLDGKKVTVAGLFQRRRGVEISLREIVIVTALTPAKAKQERNNRK